MLVPQVSPPFPLSWGFSTKLDAPENLPPVRLSQVHGCGIVGVGKSIQEGDGIWTTEPGVCLGVRVADCVPILLAGFVNGQPWVAALHAGWRGAIGVGQDSPGGGILRRGLELFYQQGGDLVSLVWALGPCIQPCHFEVGEEVIAAARHDPAWHEGLLAKGKHGNRQLDLHGLLRAQGLHIGLNPSNDGSLQLCTHCQEDLFWSYRRGDRAERQWGWIEIG